jgi:ABC-type transport system involved in multi-copper enzyme maturation permease subunit
MRLIRAELMKIRTTSTWWIFGLITLGLWGITLLFNYFQSDFLVNPQAGAPTDDPGFAAAQQPINIASNLYTNGQLMGLAIILVLGAIVVTNEFFHQTVTTTFLTTPHRTAVVVAKFVAAGILGLLFWAVTTALNLIVTPAILSGLGLATYLDSGTVWRAVGFGVLIRSQIGATITAMALYFVGYIGAAIFFGVLSDRFGDWFDNLQVLVPSLASQLMVSGTELPGSPPQWAGAVVLIGYAVVTGVVGTLITRTRDVS